MEVKEKAKIGYKKTELGLIPEDWNLKTIGELTDKIGDGIHSTPVYNGTGKFYFINGNNLENGKVSLDEDTKRLDDFESKKHIRPLNSQTILLSINGTIGNVAFYQNENVVLGKSAAYINIKKNVVREFFYYTIQTERTQLFFRNNLTGSTIKNLGLGTIRSTPLSLPPTLAEQKAIATALSDVDALIEKLEALITKKQAIKEGVMQRLLTPPNKGGQRLPGFDGEWEEKTIESYCLSFTKQTGFDYSNHIKPKLVKNNSDLVIPFIQNKDFDGTWINYNTDYYIPKEVAYQFPRILLNEKCLLISISGSIGKVGVFNNDKTAFIGGAVAVGKFKDKSLLEWVMYYLKSRTGQNMMFKDVKAGSHQNLILDDIRKMIVPVPALEIRNKVVDILNSMEKEILLLRIKKTKYQKIKEGMMQELLTGKTRLV